MTEKGRTAARVEKNSTLFCVFACGLQISTRELAVQWREGDAGLEEMG